MSKIAVLLKGAHKMGATIQLEASDIVASAPYLENAERITFTDVEPVFSGDQVDNIVRSIGITESLDGVARILIDHSSERMPITPNSGDIYLWNPAATTDNLA